MLCHEWFTGVRAVIPKRLPVSALHMEPNFFDLERKHSPSTESENSRPSTGLRDARRPLENVGYQNHRNTEIPKEDGVLKRNSSRPSSAVPIKSSTPSTATRPSSAGASKPRSSLRLCLSWKEVKPRSPCSFAPELRDVPRKVPLAYMELFAAAATRGRYNFKFFGVLSTTCIEIPHPFPKFKIK